MYRLPTSNYLQRSLAMNHRKPHTKQPKPMTHKQRVASELQTSGASRVAMRTMESRYLHNIIKQDEHIMAMVYGHHQEGNVMLVATDKRMIFLDKKPLFVNDDEISYGMIGGVSVSNAGMGTTVVMHTRIKDYKVVTLNRQSAEKFAEYIESKFQDTIPQGEFRDYTY
jgi:hypothetical protein